MKACRGMDSPRATRSGTASREDRVGPARLERNGALGCLRSDGRATSPKLRPAGVASGTVIADRGACMRPHRLMKHASDMEPDRAALASAAIHAELDE